MSAQLYNVGDQVELEGRKYVVVDIPSEEGKSGTYFSYTLMLVSEYEEKLEAKGEEVAAEQNKKLTPELTSDEGTDAPTV